MPHADSTEAGSAYSPERVAELVRSLAAVMFETSVTELDLSLDTLTLRLRRTAQTGREDRALPLSHASVELSPPAQGHVVTSPMVGTFYAAPTPSAPPFVAEGDKVVTGQTIGIIEAMKIMNEIVADQSGVVIEFMAHDAQPVEYGSPLLRLATDVKSS